MASYTLSLRQPTSSLTYSIEEDTLAVVVNARVKTPWFTLPPYSRKVSGSSSSYQPYLYKFSSRQDIKSLTEGVATIEDTKRDGYGDGDSNHAGEGCHVDVLAGDLVLTYSHLARQSARSGSVKVGGLIGRSGDSGYIKGGSGGYYVGLSAAVQSSDRPLASFSAPYEIWAYFDGNTLPPQSNQPTLFPEGQLEARDLLVGSWPFDETDEPGDHVITVRMVEKGQGIILAEDQVTITLE